MTGVGVILGTAAYMSPEQARGKPVDKRADIWAFGCVLYEMLAGARAFRGETVSETLAEVMKSEPRWTALPPEMPTALRNIVRRCLEKDPRQRVRDIGDVRIGMQDARAEATTTLPVPVVAGRSRERLAWTAAALLAVVSVVGVAVTLVPRPNPTAPEMRVEITTPATSSPLQFALSPDGRHLVFVASGGGPERLWLRALDKTDAQPMAGTDGAEYPFWSAESRSIGFFASGKLYRIDSTGGPPEVVTNASAGRGGAWNATGTILFTPTPNSPLSRIAASGGEPVAVTRLDPPQQTSHRFPQFLPDGRHFLFYAQGSPNASGIYLGSLDGGEPKRLTAADTAGAYLQPDRLIFVRQGALTVRRLDVARGELTGDPLTMASPVGSTNVNLGGFSVSADGRVAYRAGGNEPTQLTWFDRTGKVLGVAGAPEVDLSLPELSPDGRQVAFERSLQRNLNIWGMDLVHGRLTRLTFDAADRSPVWSPDGTRIAFSSSRKGPQPDLYLKPSTGAAATEELLLQTPNLKRPQDWSRDGRFLLYFELDPKTARDLWVLDMSGRKPRVFVNTPYEERIGQFSPDGRWIAYETNESGEFQVVVQPFPEPSRKWQISTTGGTQPRWRADGMELYFIAPDGKLMAVPVTAPGATFEAGTPVALFPTRIGTPIIKPDYAVSRDGRFLINQTVEEATAMPITLILNWKPR